MSEASQAPAKRVKTSTTNTNSIPDSPNPPSHNSAGYMSASAFSNPYHHQAYANNPGPYTFPQQNYVSHQPLPQPLQNQSLQSNLQIPQQSILSPPNPRKRRTSDLEDASASGASNMSNYSLHSMPQQTMMSGSASGASGYRVNDQPQQGKVETGLGISQAGDLQSPTPKKGRTNTPWTPAEEQRLKHMRDAGNSWSEIARTFPNRTEGSVKKHWYKDMHYAEFAEDEGSFKSTLLKAIKEYESSKWKIIGQKVGKPAKACEQFAKEHLNKGAE